MFSVKSHQTSTIPLSIRRTFMTRCFLCSHSQVTDVLWPSWVSFGRMFSWDTDVQFLWPIEWESFIVVVLFTMSSMFKKREPQKESATLTRMTRLEEVAFAGQDATRARYSLWNHSLFVLHHWCVRLSRVSPTNRRLLDLAFRQWKWVGV